MTAEPWRRVIFVLAPWAAAVGYGGWAGLINGLDDNPGWPLVVISHAAYAFSLTFLGDRLTRRLRRRLAPLTTLGVMSAVTVLTPLVIQLAVGNTQLGLSLAPGLVIGHGFLIAVLLDERASRHAPAIGEPA